MRNGFHNTIGFTSLYVFYNYNIKRTELKVFFSPKGKLFNG